MAASADGRIVVDGWPDAAAAAVRGQYEQVHASYEADGWICGRITMEPMAGATRSEEEVAHEHSGGTREDFAAPGDHESFAVAYIAEQLAEPRGQILRHRPERAPCLGVR